MGGGGGGDGGYEAQQAETEARKKAAREELNRQFGYGDPASIDRAKYTRKGTPVSGVAAPASTFNPQMDQILGDLRAEPGDRLMFQFGNRPTAQQEMTPDVFDQAGYDAEVASLGKNRNAREGLYQSVRENAYNAGKRGLDEQQEAAQRALKFELFAKGLAGGSEDINQNALLGRTYSQGLLDLGGKADAAKAQFQGDDESTRLGLLQSIDAGMDQGSALSSAINQMKVNQDRAAAEAQGTTLGDLFANTALISNQDQYRRGKQAGTEWWNNYNPAGSSGSRRAAGGTVTGVN